MLTIIKISLMCWYFYYFLSHTLNLVNFLILLSLFWLPHSIFFALFQSVPIHLKICLCLRVVWIVCYWIMSFVCFPPVCLLIGGFNLFARIQCPTICYLFLICLTAFCVQLMFYNEMFQLVFLFWSYFPCGCSRNFI